MAEKIKPGDLVYLCDPEPDAGFRPAGSGPDDWSAIGYLKPPTHERGREIAPWRWIYSTDVLLYLGRHEIDMRLGYAMVILDDQVYYLAIDNREFQILAERLVKAELREAQFPL